MIKAKLDMGTLGCKAILDFHFEALIWVRGCHLHHGGARAWLLKGYPHIHSGQNKGWKCCIALLLSGPHHPRLSGVSDVGFAFPGLVASLTQVQHVCFYSHFLLL